MNKKDLGGALALIGVYAVVLASETHFPQGIEALLFLGRPISTALILGGVAALYCYHYHATALIAALLSIYLLKHMWTTWPRSDARRLHLEIGRDQARFDPSNSIDLQFANGTAKHDLPFLLSQPTFPEMLIFPPSAKTLLEMNGD